MEFWNFGGLLQVERLEWIGLWIGVAEMLAGFLAELLAELSWNQEEKQNAAGNTEA